MVSTSQDCLRIKCSNPIFDIVKHIKLPIDLIYIILSYDSIIYCKKLYIKYLNQLFLDFKHNDFAKEYFPGWKNINKCHELSALIKTDKASINWDVIESNEQDNLLNGICPNESLFTNRRAISKVALCVLRYPLKRRILILKNLGKESLCDDYISKYDCKSLFSKLKYELKNILSIEYDEQYHKEYEIDQYINRKNKKNNKLMQSKKLYNIRKMNKIQL